MQVLNKQTEADPFFGDRLILVSFAFAASLNIILWIALLIKFGISSDQVPLHYSVVYGISSVGDSRLVYQIPVAGIVVFLINWWIAKSFYGVQKLISYFAILAAATIQLLLLIQVSALLIFNS